MGSAQANSENDASDFTRKMILAKKAMARLWIPDPLYLSSKLLSCYDYGRFTSSGIFPRSRPKRSLSRSLATAQPKCSAGCDSLPCRPRFVTMKFSQGDTVACPALQKAFYLGGILACRQVLLPLSVRVSHEPYSRKPQTLSVLSTLPRMR